MTASDLSKLPVVTAHPDETLTEVAKRMRDEHVGDVVVADASRRPVGMLTDRDIVVSAVAQSPDKIEALLVGDVMTRDVVTARGHELVDDVLHRMRARGVRRIPVVSADGRLEGVVTLDDILKVMSIELSEVIGLMAREQKQERVTRP